MRRALTCALAVALAAASPAPALGDPALDQARAFYDAGARAYAAGSYAAAVQAFSAAYNIVQKPTVLFSLAQAERRQYTAERDASALRDAIKHFRAYIEEVRQGGRRADAVDALAELEASATRLERPIGEADARPSPPLTRIMVTPSVRAAVVTLDGADHVDLPVIEDVAPGKHRIRVTATGYLDEEREVVAVEGTLLPLEISLRERPSFIAISAPAGARVTVDGRPVGEAPLTNDIEVTAGAHLVGVSKTGSSPYLAWTTAERGQVAPVHVELRRTGQRRLSYLLMGTAATAAVASCALALGALDEEDSAQTITTLASRQNISEKDRETYTDELSARDHLRTAAAVTAGVAGALGVVAAGLYAFDDPVPSLGELPRSTRAPKPALTVGLAGAGLTVRLRF